jgi:hypothetical protein
MSLRIAAPMFVPFSPFLDAATFIAGCARRRQLRKTYNSCCIAVSCCFIARPAPSGKAPEHAPAEGPPKCLSSAPASLFIYIGSMCAIADLFECSRVSVSVSMHLAVRSAVKMLSLNVNTSSIGRRSSSNHDDSPPGHLDFSLGFIEITTACSNLRKVKAAIAVLWQVPRHVRKRQHSRLFYLPFDY